MRRRLYLDETVWVALACEGEMREAVAARLRSLIQAGWSPVTSTFAMDRLVGLETEAGRLLEFISIVRRISSEIIPSLPEDFDRAAQEILSNRLSLTGGLHLTIARRGQCEGLLSFAAELSRHRMTLSPV